MGKSVLLATMAMQFRRYRLRASSPSTSGAPRSRRHRGGHDLGGEHYDLGADGEIAFQPLARIDREGYRAWAAEWDRRPLLHEGVAVGPDVKERPSGRRWEVLAGAPVEQAHDDRELLRAAAIERLRRRSRPTCWAARTASCWTPTATASAADVQGFEMED